VKTDSLTAVYDRTGGNSIWA